MKTRKLKKDECIVKCPNCDNFHIVNLTRLINKMLEGDDKIMRINRRGEKR